MPFSRYNSSNRPLSRPYGVLIKSALFASCILAGLAANPAFASAPPIVMQIDADAVDQGASNNNDGAQILRRAYSYNDGVSLVAERWPPWRQAMEYDAGLLFICYQRDPRTGFIKMFDKMSKFDMMNQFTTHVGGGLFACPRGAADGEFIGQRLFEKV